MAPFVWFITGASAGFGLELSKYALSQGHQVIATVRSRTKSADAVSVLEAAGAKIIQFDVTDLDAIPEVVRTAETAYGQIDVLVNNAGYSLLGAIEDFTNEENLRQFQTNFFGPVQLIRAVLPSMRARRSGVIVNITSIAGQDGLPSCGMYAASKFALEGLSESLAHEVANFGISVLIVEPGAFRTNFLHSLELNSTGVSAPYQNGPVATMLGKFDTARGKQMGDPKKGVARIWEVVLGEGVAGNLKGKILRLPLGQDCLDRLNVKLDKMRSDVDACKEVAASTAFD